MAHSLGVEDRVLGQPLKTLSGGRRQQVEPIRILFSGADSTLLLDEADQPPRRRLDRVAARTPEVPTRAAWL